MSSEEHLKGTLETGKWADLAILSADYFSVPDESIKSLESVLTMVGGKVVHAAGPYSRMAPAPLPVSPDWLPAGRKQASAAAIPLAGGHAHPLIIGDAGPWTLGCGCGLL
jgi:hypothetical protein